MHLAFKYAAVLSGGIALVLIVPAAQSLEEIRKLQEREIKDDVSILVTALSSGAGELWTAAGRQSAERFIQSTNKRHIYSQIRLLPLPENNPKAGSETTVELLESQDHHWQVVAHAPVSAHGTLQALVEVRRELPDEREYLNSVIRGHLGTTLWVAVAAGALSVLLGLWFIRRPLKQLSELAHRVATGDFSARTKIRQRDEIGKLAAELDTMTDRLLETHLEVQKERRARTAALEQLRHADRLSTIGKLASSLAHELGTPLNVVAGHASLIEGSEGAAADVRDSARTISEQASHMTKILRELLDFARRKKLKRNELRIGDLLEHAAHLLEPVCEEHNVALRLEGELDTPVRVDKSKMLQVLMNLSMNAIHAMPDGGKLRLSVSTAQVDAPKDAHVSPGAFARLDVRDEGMGIAEERLGRIFDAFYTTKSEGSGTGLGLTISHGIIREHDGFIDVESVVGTGTTFSVYLPLDTKT